MIRVLLTFWKGLMLLPLLSLIYLSLQSAWRFPELWSPESGLQHWRDTLQGSNALLQSLVLSLSLSGSIALCCACGGLLISGLIMRQNRPYRWLVLAYFPYLIAPVVLAAMLQFYFVSLRLNGSFGGVWLAQGLFVLPYAVLFFSGFWTGNTARLMAQAQTLGANPIQVLQRVIWPMGRPWLVMGIFQCFLLSWFEYGLSRLIGVGKVHTLTIQTLYFVQEGNPHLAAVASLLMLIPPMILLLVNRRVLFHQPFSSF